MPEASPRFEQRLHGQPCGLHAGARAFAVDAGFLRGPPRLLILFGAGVEQKLHGLTSEVAVLAAVGGRTVHGEIRHHRQGVGVHLRVQMVFDKLPGALDRRSLVAGVLQRPGEVSGDAQHVGVVAVGGAFVDERRVRLPASILLLLRGQPLLRARDELRVHVVDLRHVEELHQAVGGQNLVRRDLPEPGKSAAGNLEGQQALITVGDVPLRLGMNLRRQLFGALHVIERQHVGISAGRRLLKAAVGHAQKAVHAFHHLAQGAGIEPDKNLAGVRNGIRREPDLMLHGGFQAAVEYLRLLAAVGDNLNFPHYDVRAPALRPSCWQTASA